MLKPIRHLLDNPNDVPDVPRVVKEYLQSYFNHAYLRESGTLKRLREEGHSDTFIMGVVEGLAIAASVMDEMEHRKAMQQEV